MSKEQFGETTRRAFLGTATVATAASLTGPTAGADQSADRVNPAGTIKLAEANVDVPEQLAARAKAGDWTKPAATSPKKDISSLNRDVTVRSFLRRRPTTASRLSRKSNRGGKTRSAPTERP